MLLYYFDGCSYILKSNNRSSYHLISVWPLDSATSGCNTQRHLLLVPCNHQSLNLPCYLFSMVKVQAVPVTRSRSVGRLRFTAEGHVRGSGRSGHTLTWPLPPPPGAWSQRLAWPAPAGSGGSPEASRSLCPRPAWLWPSASCNNGETNVSVRLVWCQTNKCLVPYVLQ